MDDPPCEDPADEDAVPSVDVHHGHGVLIGDGGTQTNYFYVATAGTADAAPADQAAAAPPPSRCAEVDFTRLGVHPALGFADVHHGEEGGRDWYPPYVPRDRDGQIDQALAGGGLVIVEGRSGAGKSRAAAEAVRRVAADWRLLIPADRRELAALSQPPGRLRNAVVWLDNLERFGGQGGLDLSMLERLCPRGRRDVVILATLRSEERQSLEEGWPGAGPGSRASAADALRVAAVIRLGLEFSAAERKRAATMRADPRIAGWLDHGGSTGLAEYLAAGPPAVDRWLGGRDGENVLGAALVSAAVDCRRLRYTEPLPLDRLTELARFYLDPRDAYRPGRPTFEQALEWATKPVSGASSCLLPLSGDRYWAFDYLVDHQQRDPGAPPVPAEVLSALLSWVPDEEARHVIGQVAVGVFDTDRPLLADLALTRFGQIAGFEGSSEFVAGILATTSFSDRGPEWQFSTRYVRWLRPFAEEGNAAAIGLIGVTLLESTDGDIEQGEAWLRRATAAGHDDSGRAIARLLLDTGRRTELESWIDGAVAEGRGEGIVVGFATDLLSRGKRAEAKHWCQRGADLGDPASMVALGELCLEDEEWVRAEDLFTAAAQAGHPVGMYDLSLVLERLVGHGRQAEEWLRRSAENRYQKAILKYALLLDQRGDEAELERWLEREQAAGDSEHVLEFAMRLAARGNMRGAERWFRHAMEMGNIRAIRGTGDVRLHGGDLQGAAAYYQQAIDRGDIVAMHQLSTVYIRQDAPGKAGQLLRGMLDTRFDFRDRTEEEEEALGRAAGRLGFLLESQGKTEEAEDMYETATHYGIADARYDLARLRGRRDG